MIDPFKAGDRSPLTSRWLGVPLLFAVAYSAVGFSLYFALGLVAERGLGLTPLIFLGVGLVFILNTLTYVEGEAMVPERGGSATFARHAFNNELVSFIAGWAILIDYVIVIALAALSVPHYLTPIWSGFSDTAPEIVTGSLVVALTVFLTITGVTGVGRQRLLGLISIAGVGLLLAVIAIGLATAWDPSALTAELDPFTSPTLEDVIYAGVIATVAFAGIEAAANLAPDIQTAPVDLRKLVVAAATLVPLIYVGVSVVALMAVPVVPTADGPQTALGTTYLENPVLGVVENFEPAWLSSLMQAAVVAVVPAALIWAANTAMLGLSRHVYTLATNRQIPSWLGKLNRRYQTPYVAIASAGVIAIGLVAPADVALLGGLFAFGATIAFTIAHLSVIRMRISEPDRPRPFRIPFDVTFRGARVPLPTLAAAALTALAWLSVIVYHDTARWVGGGWMLFGLVAYVIYRKGVEGMTLSERVEVPPEALVKDVGRARVRRHPRAGVRDQARRRHRRYRRAARRRRRSAGRDPAAARGRLRDRPAADRTARFAAAARPRGGRQRGAGARPGGGGGVRDRRGPSVRHPSPLDRRRDRRGGARPRSGDDRVGGRTADPNQGRCDPRRDRGLAPGRDRAGDRVRAAPRAMPGAGHGAGHRRRAAGHSRLGR